MHPNQIYRQNPRKANLAFARERGFGMLSVNGDNGPLAAHVPFVLSPEGDTLDIHLVRSNPIVGALKAPMPALVAVIGADGYVSPDWYGMEDQVPTWNYVAVHLRGRLEPLPAEALRSQIDRLSELFETRLAPKKPWRSHKMTEEVLARMMRAIVPLRLTIDSVDGTWKLSQNKPEPARLGAAEGVLAGTPGQETAALAALMRSPPW
ncbi:MAG TPA: FMN-binding negative transcriptional regulator [Albidovulum sp.]|uniref:FMN-binding negative transcriptional regulator n=1 Tax=Albidovulum sp. TaxID=1872424 RepID=UPI002BEC5794|nr:FMN-binding negative transcriptional regulator [Albidovulum sp.]